MDQKIKVVKKFKRCGQRCSIMSLVWYMRGHFRTLVFAFYFNFGISIMKKKIKYGLVSNHLLQTTQEYDGWKEPQGNNKFLRRILSSSCHME